MERRDFRPLGVEQETSISRHDDRKSVVVGSIWMVVISLALFFLPLINGFVGGLVGGYMVGTVKRALVAAVLPAIVVAIGMWIVLALFDLPLVGLFASMALGVLVLLADIGLFIGAAVGGAARSQSEGRRPLQV